MELLVLDTDFKSLTIVDTFESLIWTDRYQAYGDFEIYTPIDAVAASSLQPDYYLYSQDSEHCMIVEDKQIKFDAENGIHFTITGRSLESILCRRVIWNLTNLTGNLQNGIQQLLNENAINPTDTNRKIANLIFEASTDPVITALTVSAQYHGENLYDEIQKLCALNKIGFKVTLSNDNKFVFKLYAGKDRSYSQTTNPYVIFSPKFENIINSNYIESKKPLRTVSLVGGEGEGVARKMMTVEVTGGGGSGLNRREMFTDANNISSSVSGGTLTTEQYNALLTQAGKEDLAENTQIQSFEGQVDATRMFKYGTDFFMGDIVQLVNEYGMEAKSRVTELVFSQSLQGTDIYPTFTAV